MTAPLNTDLPASNLIPGVYVQINTNGGSAVDNANKRALILANRLTTGSVAADTPFLCTDQSTANASVGTGSDAARNFAAFQSQYGPGEFETWICGVNAPSGGTAATQLITVAGTATSAGYVDVYVCGYRATVGIASGDTAATTGAAITAAVNLITDLPVTAGGSATVTLTYRHKGLYGNDLPVRVDQFDAAGLTFSPGTITYATGVTGAGSALVNVGATTITTAIANADTAAAAATKVAASINGASYPVTCSDDLGGVLTLLYAKGRTVRRVTASIVTSTGITSTAACGTAGAGVSTLTTALSNIGALSQGFAAWSTPFIDQSGGEATAIDAIYDEIQVDCNGVNQKPGYVFVGTAAKLTTAGLVVTTPDPDLSTTSPLSRFNVSWCKESPVQAHEIAARHAAIYLHPDFYAKNLDGTVLATRGTVPLLNPAIADRPPLSDANAAMGSYYMSPITVDSQGNLCVMRSMTCSNASNQDLRETCTIRQIDTARLSLRQYLVALFSGKSYRASNPKTPNTVTTRSVKDAAYVWMRQLDDADLFDDATEWKSAVQCNVNAINNTRFDLYVPLAVIRALHQLGVVLQPV